MGWSVGRWEGDTLVVDVTNQKPETWLDRAGNFHSEQLRVEERYTVLGPNHLQYDATLEDPKVFSRPWKISLPLYRRIETNAELLEFKCVPFAEEILYGHLRKGRDGESARESDAMTSMARESGRRCAARVRLAGLVAAQAPAPLALPTTRRRGSRPANPTCRACGRTPS